MTDQIYMRRAIQLALRGTGLVNPNPLVGAVIVKDGRMIGEGWHHQYGHLHAEREALASLTESAEGATMYVTLEPCCHYGKQPPCTEAIIEHRIARVIVGSSDPNPKVAGKGVRQLREHGIIVEEGFLKEECDAINPVFFHFINTGRPFIRMKYAMTADGKIATKTGASQWISCEESRERVHRMRHENMGIMAGIGTVLADDPMLNCRIPGGKDPIRIICDTHLRIPKQSRIVSTAGEIRTILACGFPELPEGPVTAEDISEDISDRVSEKIRFLIKAGVKILNYPLADSAGVDLDKLCGALGQMNIDSILLEGGGILNESALRAGIVNEINVFMAPKIFGGKARSPVEGIGVSVPDEARRLTLVSTQKVGEDLLIVYRTDD